MRLLVCFAFFGLIASAAHAGAWTQNEGEGLLIASGVYYATDSYYDNQGRKTAQPTYSKYEFDPYAEYGINDWLTAGGSLSLQRAQQDQADSGGSEANFGLGDSELFLRARLWQQSGFVVSVQPEVTLPSPEELTTTPQLGSRHPDAGLGLSGGYGFTLLGRNHFVDLDAEYRYRFGSPKDRVNLAATLGISVTQDLMLMPQLFYTGRMGAPSQALFTESSGDDYDLASLQLSAVYKLTDAMSLQAGGFVHAGGRNTGAGDGVLLAIWERF